MRARFTPREKRRHIKKCQMHANAADRRLDATTFSSVGPCALLIWINMIFVCSAKCSTNSFDSRWCASTPDRHSYHSLLSVCVRLCTSAVAGVAGWHEWGVGSFKYISSCSMFMSNAYTHTQCLGSVFDICEWSIYANYSISTTIYMHWSVHGNSHDF